ncbi:MAG: NPCBM/NEW2 domain-containing protein [Candidatus Omnitrophota bacterium]
MVETKNPYEMYFQNKGIIAAAVIILLIVIWSMIPARDIYISDIDELNVLSFEWKEPIRDKTVDGNSLLIDEKWYPKGMGVHANSEISLKVPRGYTHFIADAGVDDEISQDKPASVQFMVLGDGAVLFETPVIKAGMPPRRIYANIEGVEVLTLKAMDGGDGSNSDHGDWGNARFVKR